MAPLFVEFTGRLVVKPAAPDVTAAFWSDEGLRPEFSAATTLRPPGIRMC